MLREKETHCLEHRLYVLSCIMFETELFFFPLSGKQLTFDSQNFNSGQIFPAKIFKRGFIKAFPFLAFSIMHPGEPIPCNFVDSVLLNKSKQDYKETQVYDWRLAAKAKAALMSWFSNCSPRSAVSATPGKWTEVQFLRSSSRTTETETVGIGHAMYDNQDLLVFTLHTTQLP